MTGYIWHTHYPSSVTLRDPTLPHQIVINGDNPLTVSCNCRIVPGTSGGHGPRYEPLAVIIDAKQARHIYEEHLWSTAHAKPPAS